MRNNDGTTRQQRRASARAARKANLNMIEAPPEFDITMDDDAKYFAENSTRSYRVRYTSTAELEVERMVGICRASPAVDQRFYTIVRQVASGQRQRQTHELPADTDCNMPEAAARALWEQNVPSSSAADYISGLSAARLHSSVDGRTSEKSPAEDKARDCLCLRLPITPSTYHHETAAVEALEGFAAALDMGRPLVIGPGDAIYGVWRFPKRLPLGEWVTMAGMLESLARSYGLYLDGPVIRDPGH